MAQEIIKRDPADVMKDLPEVCYTRHIGSNKPVLLKRGVVGFFDARPGMNPDAENEWMGVNVAQEAAMVCGSIAGWHVPGADPLNYTDPTIYAKLEAMRSENIGGGAR